MHAMLDAIVGFTELTYSGVEGGSPVEVCVELTALPSGGSEVNIVVQLMASDGDKSG